MAGTCKGENTSSSWRQDFSPDHWSLAANTSRKRPWFRDCSFWVFRYRFWGAQNERDCDSTRSIQTKTEASLHYGKFDWLDSLGTLSSGSTGVKKKTLFLVSAFFFFFWKSFQNVLLWTAAQVSYSAVKIIASFLVIEDLVLSSRSLLWMVCSVLSYKYMHP